MLKPDRGSFRRMKHPLSTLCAYTMLVALIIFGVAGLALEYPSMVPSDLRTGVQANALPAILFSLVAAFVAASLASMRAASHTERAWQAGEGHRRIFYVALIYTACCITIEVIIGKLGAHYVGAEVNSFALTLLCTFFAVAPRLVSYILAGMDGIERMEQEARADKTHTQDIERINAVKGEAEARINAGITSLDDARTGGKNRLGKAATGVLAGALALGGAQFLNDAQAAPHAPFHEPTHQSIAAPFHADSDKASRRDRFNPYKGREAVFLRACALLQENPDLAPADFRKQLGLPAETARRFYHRAMAELNPDMFENGEA